MKQARKPRIIAALVALLSVLFAQLAVAAYVCPSIQLTQAIAAVQLQGPSVEHFHSSDCDEADSKSPALCHAHNQVGTQSLDKPPVPNISPFVAIALFVTVVQDGMLSRVPSYAIDSSFLRRTTAPPLSIRNCCFRI